jgi:hypothetical protein
MSWIGATFGGLLGIALIAAAGDKTFQDQAGVSSSDGAASLRLVGILMILWCILVAALAVKAFRRKRWGAIGLAVMGTAFALFTLFNMVASGNATGLPGLAWVVAAVVLVLNKSREWYAAR